MGFQMRKAAARTALIGVMLGGGLLYAGISQAQDSGLQAERDAELAAAAGGPATSAHLIPYAADAAAVDVRDEDVAPAQLARVEKPAPSDRSQAAGPEKSPALQTAQAAPAR